jgi:hypothetical protein
MTFAAIKTLYNGIKFRSRLEAKWAAFFDLLGWEWEYEPFDLNGWIPDFLLKHGRVLVEVKPVDAPPSDIMAEISGILPDDYEALIVGHSISVQNWWRYRIDWETGKQVEGSVIIKGSEGLPIGWMLGRAPDWQPTIEPTWGLAGVSRFYDRICRELKKEFEAGQSDLWYPDIEGWGLFHCLDPWFRVDPGYNPRDSKTCKAHPPGDCSCNDCDAYFNRLMGGAFDLLFWSTKELLPLWREAANRTQWRSPS